MCQFSLNQPIATDVWSDEWLEKTLASFNVPGEMEWDKCDVCCVPTHIHIAKWAIINDQVVLLCKQCQIKSLC
jgi:hypothetical protein